LASPSPAAVAVDPDEVKSAKDVLQILTDARRAARRRHADILPSRTKPGQANPNKMAWICLVLFVRIGTFQWVAPIPNKNFFPALRLAAGAARRSLVAHGLSIPVFIGAITN
jgi:hypothetical protein